MGWRAAMSTFGATFIALAACGDEAPPLLGDNTTDAGADIIFGSETAPPTCNAGPDLGVCACTELDFLSDVPNMYFVLDRSGSMADQNKWTTVRTVVSQLMKSLGPRANFGVVMFPDPTSSDACASGVVAMGLRQGDSPAGTLGPTTTAMLKVTSAPPDGGTPTAATLRSIVPLLQTAKGRTFVILATDGGPNCDAYAACNASMCIDNIESVQGCPPSGPPNCCDPSIYGPLECLDAQPTIDAVSAIAGVSVPTYVIGVPGSGPYSGLLDQLATAGGTARSSEPLYYRVDSADESAFETALSQIAAKITATCTLTLSSPPPDPTHVNVYFDNVAVPADPTNGWTLDGSTVTLVGNACNSVMSGAVLNVRVVAACPTVPPN